MAHASADRSAVPSVPPALARTLRYVTRRVRLLRALRGGASGLFAGALLSMLVLLLIRLRLLDTDAVADVFLLVPPLLGLVAGGVWGALRPVPPLAALRLIEQRLDLKERLSTAYTLFPQTSSHGEAFAAHQVADAETASNTRADARQIATALSLRPLPRMVPAALTASLAAFLLWFLPSLPAFQSPAERAERASLRAEGERLVRIARALERQPGQKRLANARRSAEQIKSLGKEMQRGKMSRQKALIKPARLTEELKQAQQTLAAATQSSAAAQGQKSLPTAGQELAKALTGLPSKTNASTPEGATMLPQVQQALAQSDAPSLAEQLSRRADLAAAGQPGDQAGREKMAAELAALAKALKNTSLSAASDPLAKAAEALKKGDMATASRELREAARRADEAAGREEDSKALQQMADALNGQGEGDEASLAQGQEAAGEASDDAFTADGLLKSRSASDEHMHTAECLQPGGVCSGNANGQRGAGQGIGSGEGKPGGEKRPETKPWSPYSDASLAPAGNKHLNRKQQEAEVRNEKYLRLYAPDDPAHNTQVKGKRGEKGKETVSYFRGAPGSRDSRVPYYEVYSQYAPAAEAALHREDIPTSYRKQVKDYFDALRPPAKGVKK